MPKAPASYKDAMLSLHSDQWRAAVDKHLAGHALLHTFEETIVPSHRLTKHVDVRYHYICETVEHDQVRITKVPTGLNREDLFPSPSLLSSSTAMCPLSCAPVLGRWLT
jgi:hypothetical protein